MAAAVPLLVLLALTVANADPSLPKDLRTSAQAVFSSAAPPLEPTAAVPGSNVIPAGLQEITQCMLDAAKAAPGVISAERAVSSQNGEADIRVSYEYRLGDGSIAGADYSARLDTLRDILSRAASATRPIVRFWLIESGVAQACDPIARSGRYYCPRNPGPVIFEAVKTAWRQTCGVEVEYLSL